MFDQAFCSDFLANLLATILGIAFGLPAALWLDRKARSRSERERKKEAHERITKIITVLRTELEDTDRAIDTINDDLVNHYCPVTVESWNAFSDGGELQWLNDPDLLGTFSRTYASIKEYDFLFRQYARATFFPSSVGGPELKDRIYQSLLKQRDHARKLIGSTLVVIEQKLKEAQPVTRALRDE
jgi:hypothetical protein